jgi:hypothetical protein
MLIVCSLPDPVLWQTSIFAWPLPASSPLVLVVSDVLVVSSVVEDVVLVEL